LGGSSAGSSTAALAFGGANYPTTSNLAVTEVWNGSTWTEVNDLNTGRESIGGCGTSTAAQANGGGATYPSSAVYNVTEQYNGTSWTEVNNLNTARDAFGYGSPGTQSASMAMGGKGASPVPKCTLVETFNGTSWSTSTVLPAEKSEMGSSGANASSAICFGGTGPGGSNHAETQVWTDPVYAIKTVTVS
jgi:hypothetical protein